MDHPTLGNHFRSRSTLWPRLRIWSSDTSNFKETLNLNLKREYTHVGPLIHWTWSATLRRGLLNMHVWQRSSMHVLQWLHSLGSLSKQRPTNVLHIWAIHFTSLSLTPSASSLKPTTVFVRSIEICESCKVCILWPSKHATPWYNMMLLISTYKHVALLNFSLTNACCIITCIFGTKM